MYTHTPCPPPLPCDDRYKHGYLLRRMKYSTAIRVLYSESKPLKWIFLFLPVCRYINPFWLVLASNLAAALYAFLFVPESVSPDPSAKLLTVRHHRAVLQLFYRGGGEGEGDVRSNRCKLWLYTLCFFLVVAVHSGSRDLYVLYELSSPLCWGPALIGYGSAAQHLAYMSSLVGLKVMQRCLEDSWVALVGLASNIVGLVVISVADTTPLMFTGERL